MEPIRELFWPVLQICKKRQKLLKILRSVHASKFQNYCGKNDMMEAKFRLPRARSNDFCHDLIFMCEVFFIVSAFCCFSVHFIIHLPGTSNPTALKTIYLSGLCPYQFKHRVVIHHGLLLQHNWKCFPACDRRRMRLGGKSFGCLFCCRLNGL